MLISKNLSRLIFNKELLSDRFVSTNSVSVCIYRLFLQLSDNEIEISHRLKRQKQEKTKSEKDEEICSEAHINGMIFVAFLNSCRAIG